jgi:hypothetical protein
MRTRKKSAFARAREMAPVFAVVGTGVAGVFLAMNLMAISAPVAVGRSYPPTTSPTPSFAASPSLLPLASTITTVVTTPRPAPLPGKPPVLVNSAVSAADPNGVWVVYLRYPAFLAGTTPWAETMNDDLLTELQARAAQWESGPAANPRADGGPNKLTGTFETELLTSALAAFTLTWVDDSSTAVPATNAETVNYDLSTGQRIGFADLFTVPSVALKVISNAAVPMLQAELGADYDPSVALEGTSATADNYNRWALRSSGLKITFGENQVISRPGLLPTVIVPWEVLRPVMIQTGPVARLAGF